MEKLVLRIEAVEDRTAPIMFTERNLPGACCCTCCCCCCGTTDAANVHNALETSLVSVIEANGGGGPSVVDFTPYKEAGFYDFIYGLDYGVDYSSTYYRIWDQTYKEYMDKQY